MRPHSSSNDFDYLEKCFFVFCFFFVFFPGINFNLAAQSGKAKQQQQQTTITTAATTTTTTADNKNIRKVRKHKPRTWRKNPGKWKKWKKWKKVEKGKINNNLRYVSLSIFPRDLRCFILVACRWQFKRTQFTIRF